MNNLTEKQLDVLGHTLGINVYHAKLSKKKRDKKLPKEFYRNYFCASEGHSDYNILCELENMKLMERWYKDNYIFFHVLEEGIPIFRENFNKIINYV
jgi:hypothetical protein